MEKKTLNQELVLKLLEPTWLEDLIYTTYEATFYKYSVQSLSRVRLFVIPWITARQASLSITNS